MPQEEKSIYDHITDWFRELRVLGIKGLLVGLGGTIINLVPGMYGTPVHEIVAALIGLLFLSALCFGVWFFFVR